MTGPKWPVVLAGILAVVLLVVVVVGCIKPAQPSQSIQIHPCAAVLTRGEEQVCR
jgi:hypothetical protein